MRKPRLLFPGALFHVIVRGNHGLPTFLDHGDFTRYLELLGEVSESQKFHIYSYCLMPNHAHLLLEQVGPYSLSKFMQRIQTAYTAYFNRKHRKTGHLFQGRFKSILVDKDVYLKELVRYIQLNPVRSNLVKDPGDYPWSGYKQYVDKEKNPPIRINTSWVLGLFGVKPLEQKKAYKNFVLEGLQEGHRHDFYKVRKGHILGGEEFEKKVHEKVGIAWEPSLHLSRNLVELWKAILQREGHEGDPGGRKRTNLLEEVAFIATQACGISQKKVGEHFGLKQSGVSRAVRRLEKRWALAPHLKEKSLHWALALDKS